jgi:hypothetical protein
MRRYVMVLSLGLLLALAPSTFAANKAPHQTRAQKAQARKNKAKAKQFAKHAKTPRQRVN